MMQNFLFSCDRGKSHNEQHVYVISFIYIIFTCKYLLVEQNFKLKSQKKASKFKFLTNSIYIK